MGVMVINFCNIFYEVQSTYYNVADNNCCNNIHFYFSVIKQLDLYQHASFYRTKKCKLIKVWWALKASNWLDVWLKNYPLHFNLFCSNACFTSDHLDILQSVQGEICHDKVVGFCSELLMRLWSIKNTEKGSAFRLW